MNDDLTFVYFYTLLYLLYLPLYLSYLQQKSLKKLITYPAKANVEERDIIKYY